MTTTEEVPTTAGCVSRADFDAIVEDFNLKVSRTEELTRTFVKANVREAIKMVFTEEAKEGTMSREDALELANKVCEAADIAPLDSLTVKYQVNVSAFGNHIMSVEVEADSEDEAQERVEHDIDIDDIELNFTISSHGEYGAGSTDDNSWNIDLASIITDNLEYYVEEVTE